MNVFPADSFYSTRAYASTDSPCQQYRSGTNFKYTYEFQGTNGTGSTCAEAIKDFNKNFAGKQKSHPVSTSSGNGGGPDILGSITKGVGGAVKGLSDAVVGAGTAIHKGDQAGVTAINKGLGLGGSASTNADGSPVKPDPNSKCMGCGSDYWNPMQWGCVIQKAACEGGHAIDPCKAYPLLCQYLPYIAVGGGALVLLLLLSKR